MAKSDQQTNGNGSYKKNGDENGNLLNEMDESLDQVQNQLTDLQSQLQPPSEKLVKLVGKQKELCRNLNESIRKTKRIAYLGLILSISATIAALAIGYFSFILQSDIRQLHRNFTIVGSELIALRQFDKSETVVTLKKSITENREAILTINSRLETIQNGVTAAGNKIAVLDRQFRKLPETVFHPDTMEISRENRGSSRHIPKTWSVNFASFKNKGYALQKAEAFSKQGFPVETLEIQIRGETWYRLYVGGFSSKEEAVTYAARVEQVLNLGSVWLGRN
jgi:hypothetical protein